MTIKYIFWDSDNTLVETRRHHWRKHFETLKSLGIHLDDKWEERIYHNNGTQNWEWMKVDLGLAVPKDEYLNLIDAWYFAHIDEIGLRDGIAEALALFEEAHLPMAVVSNGRRKSVLAALNSKRLPERMKFILCIEDYEGRKPEPTPYLAAKTRMQQVCGAAIDPRECLVIEDDPKGVQSGIAAGMNVIDRPVGDDDTQKFLDACRSYLTPPL